MSDTSQASMPAGDDSEFSPEEAAAFAEMQKDTSGDPAPAPDPAPDPTPKPDPTAAPAAGAEGAEDDDEDDDAPAPGAADAAPVAGADGAAPADGAKPKKRVSARKFERTAAELQKASGELAQERIERARLDERVKILAEALAPKPTAGEAGGPAAAAADEDPEPDAEKDIFAHNAWLRRQVAGLSARMDQSGKDRQAETEEHQIAQTYTDDASAFAASEPNFVPAYRFLMANRTFELAQYYFGIDLSEPPAKDAQGRDIPRLTADQLTKIRTVIGNEERTLATEAVKAGKSPAARIFALSKARGYRPEAAEPAADPAAAAAAKPDAGAPGSLAAPAPKVADEIANIKAGSEAAKSLSSGGGAPASTLTPEKLANMSEEDFGALVDSLSPAQEKALFGT